MVFPQAFEKVLALRYEGRKRKLSVDLKVKALMYVCPGLTPHYPAPNRPYNPSIRAPCFFAPAKMINQKENKLKFAQSTFDIA